MVYSEYTKRRILFHNSGGLSVNDIVKALLEEGIVASKSGVWKFLRKYKESLEENQDLGHIQKLMKELRRLLTKRWRMMMRVQEWNYQKL